MMPADLTYYTKLLLPPHMWLSCHPLVLPTSGKNPNTDSLITMFTAQSLDRDMALPGCLLATK